MTLTVVSWPLIVMIAIVDYGMGNLRSVQKAFEKVGADAVIVATSQDVSRADKLVLPGVGAVRPAMDRLGEMGLPKTIKAHVEKAKPFLGICLGFQLLFDSSTEGGFVSSLGILPGHIERFPETVKVPQVGWNELELVQDDCPMFEGIRMPAFVYFCHSYFAKPQNFSVAATITNYGTSYVSSVCFKNIWGVQFHPEKSQDVGLGILRNFVRL